MFWQDTDALIPYSTDVSEVSDSEADDGDEDTVCAYILFLMYVI